MRIKLITVFLIGVVVLLTAVPVLADNEQLGLLPEEMFEEPEFLGESSIPGRIEETGTYFEIKDSEYLNITLKSSEEIKVVLESIPRMISLDIEAATDGINSTELTLKGLEPSKTYYKYQDSYRNEVVVIVDENGIYGWEQDLTQPHHIWLQEEKGTIFLPNDCSKYGSWNPTTSTCTLNQNLNQSVEITTNNITLDCANHTITGNKTGYGIYLKTKTNITIQNCIVTNFSYGIRLDYNSNNTLTSITANSNYYGILLYSSSNNTLTSITANSNKYYGIWLSSYSANNAITNTTASNNNYGIVVWYNSKNNQLSNITVNSNHSEGILFSSSSNNTIKNSILKLNTYTITLLYYSNNNKIYHNNFINNNVNGPVIFSDSTNNLFDNGYPSGGNYWSDYTGIDVKKGPNQDQLGSDGIGDTPYTFYSCCPLTIGQDRYPFMTESGWEAPANQPPTVSNLGQFKSDGIISITESEITTESTVVFKATLNDPDGDQAKLQAELRQFSEPFTGIDDGAILNSDFVDSGNEATITREGLVNGQYHWRVRAVDTQGNFSEWQEFGTAGNIDFEIKLVPLYTQIRSPYPSWDETTKWFDDKYGVEDKDYKCFDTNLGYSTIRSCGCAITSQVMILRFHNVITTTDGNDVNPGTYNIWLANNNGYWPDGGVKFAKIQEYSKDESGFARVIYDGPIKFKDNATLDWYLDNLKPVILYESVSVQGVPSSHFIVADGNLFATYTVKDPTWYKTKYLAQAKGSYIQNYNNNFYGLRLFSPALALHGVDSISLNLASPAELLVTDPLGRRLGKDPITNIEYNEIPGGSYYQEGIGNPFAETPTPTKESKFIWIPNPVDGRYDIQVIGTDSGTYALDFSTYNNIGESTDASFEAVTDTGVISDYSIDYSSIPEEPTIIERIVTIEDVITEIEISHQLNLIDNNGIKNSLIKKLNNAQRQLESNRKNTTINILNAFINEVEAQKEEHIDLDTVELLIEDAQYIIEHL